MELDWSEGGVFGHMEGAQLYAECPKLEHNTNLMKRVT